MTTQVTWRTNMKRFAATLLVPVLFVSHCAKKMEEQGAVASWNPKVILSIGQAFVRKPDQDRGKLARVGMRVREGDLLLTQMESKMEIKLNTKDLLVVGENSKVILQKADGPNGQVSVVTNLFFGKTYSQIKKLTVGGSTYRVATPSATAAIRGTGFTVESDPNTKTTTIMVVEGAVKLEDKTSGSSVAIRAGQKSQVEKGKSPAKPEPLTEGDMKDVKGWVDEGVKKDEERIDVALLKETVKQSNTEPEVTTKVVPPVVVGDKLSYQLQASDADGDPLEFKLLKGPRGLSLDADGKIEWQAAIPGTFKIRVAISDGKTEVVKTFKIKVKKSLAASFTPTPRVGTSTTDFSFDASASSDQVTGKTGLQFAWDFDNNNTIDKAFSASPKASYRFGRTGTHKVRLVVKNSKGKTDEYTASVSVNDPPVVKVVVTPPTGEIGTKFKMDASGSKDSFDPLGRLSFRWDLDGDGKWDRPKSGRSKTLASLTHAYAKGGQYKVTVEVADAQGAAARGTATVGVHLRVEALAGKDIQTGVNTPVTLTGSGRDKDGKIVKLEWDLDGDGKFEHQNAKVTTVFKKKRKVVAVLRVTSSTGSTDTDSLIIVVSNAPPKATAPKTLGAPVNKKATFSGSGQDPDNKIVKYQWDFDGDGTYDSESATSGEATHVYTRAGSFRAVFKITADDGATDSCIVAVSVSNQPPEAQAGPDIVSKKGKKVWLDGKGTDPDGNVAKYEWDFTGDGTWDYTHPTSGRIKQRFEKYGIAVLRVTDSDGLTDLDTVRIVICPKGMRTIKEKLYCIDQYEWPNKRGQAPSVNLTWAEARDKCREQGKRLCTGDEWVHACRSKENRNFPYGFEFQRDACNTKGQTWVKKVGVVDAGKFPECRSAQKAFDMSGNAMEWTDSGQGKSKYARGGSFQNRADGADCTAKIGLDPAKKYFYVGFRCCK